MPNDLTKNKIQELKKINQEIKICSKCILCNTAKNPVYGEGNPDSQIVIVGEAPGAKEDELGLPFVGRSGKLLDSLLSDINLNREDVWIGNIIKHRPPKNRDPLPIEIKACEDFLRRQLKIINPLIIVTLGRFALKFFKIDGKIGLDRGNLFFNENYYIYPTYHPAAGIRNKNMLKLLKQDFLQIPNVISKIKLNKI